MQIPRKWLDNYNAALRVLEVSMLSALMSDLDRVDISDIANARNAFIAIFEHYMPGYAQLAAELSATLYEEIRAAQVGGSYIALRDTGRDAGDTERAIRAIMQIAVDGGTQTELVSQISARASLELRRSAGMNTIINANADPKKPRFARVPTPTHADYKPWAAGASHNKQVAQFGSCSFCIMLASRGFVYKSTKSAGGLMHFHADCDCKIVPSWDADGVEGYDPDAYYSAWSAIKSNDS